jgi:hypothetical protein
MQLGLRADNLASLTHQLLCASERAAVVCRVAPELAPIFQTAALTTAPATTVNSGVPRPRKPLRIFAAGVTLARRSRRGKFKLTPEGASINSSLKSRNASSWNGVFGCSSYAPWKCFAQSLPTCGLSSSLFFLEQYRSAMRLVGKDLSTAVTDPSWLCHQEYSVT